MISMNDYMQEFKRRVLELPYVREVIASDFGYIKFRTEDMITFEVKNIHFNYQRFAITFDIGVFGSNSCIGNVSWIEFTSKDHYTRWEEIYGIELDNAKK